MSRWHQRLAELRAAHDVQNVQNVQNTSQAQGFEHFEQIEQPDIVSEARSPATERAAAAWGEAEKERAAIVAEGAGAPRAWAEGFARLDPDRPPGGVPLRRWQRFVNEVGVFLDSPFCAVTAALGWGPYDLFGCNRERPLARASIRWACCGYSTATG